MTLPLIKPDWPAPASVVAFSTTREGGRSDPPYASLNLGRHVGDAEAAVRANRELLRASLPAGSCVQWLSQVHGATVIEAGDSREAPEADGAWSRRSGVACAVMTADCLPVLFCSRDGRVVAAAHAGWRGLCAGVLEATVRAMAVPPEQVLAWLGPAIGQTAFEVGAEVRDQFLGSAAGIPEDAVAGCFVPGPGTPGRYLADLYGLARLRLHVLGVDAIYGGGECTFTDSARFFSYRRDGRTGRMASLILLKGL